MYYFRWCLLLVTPMLWAKDLGTIGHAYPIVEQDMLEMIETRLGNMREEKLKKYQEDFSTRAKHTATHPVGVFLPRAKQNRQRLFDPTITAKKDITNHLGKIIVHKGTKVNPLDYIPMLTPLLLIDGDDKAQVNYALSQKDVKVVLVSGYPLNLEKTHGRKFYFDQHAQLIKRYSIKHVPSKISKENNMLLIAEIKIEVNDE